MSELFKGKYRIPSARLQTWDYSDYGMYFVTICTVDRECFFGNIVETRCIASLTDIPQYQMQLNDLGKIVELEWFKTAELRPDMNLELAEYIVMPNHFHGIIIIGDNQYNAEKFANTNIDNQQNKFGPQSKNLASIIRGFKSSITTYARKNDIPFNWQTRFYDHIINTEEEYIRIVEYIMNNPGNWHKDKFYK